MNAEDVHRNDQGPERGPDGVRQTIFGVVRTVRRRRERAVAVGGAYSRFVGLMKIVLPAIALGLMVLVALWPSLNDDGNGTPSDESPELQMNNARYYGTDEENRPFSVAAEQAVQSTNERGVVDLVRPEAELTLEDGTWIALKAERGRYNEETGKLLLLGSVNIFHDEGYEFLTDEVHVDVAEGTAWGDREVRGQGPFGELFARGFRILDRGRTVVFTGKAHMRLADGALRGP